MVTFQIHGLIWAEWEYSKDTYDYWKYNQGFCEGFPNSVSISAYISCALDWPRGGWWPEEGHSVLCCGPVARNWEEKEGGKPSSTGAV